MRCRAFGDQAIGTHEGVKIQQRVQTSTVTGS